MAALTSSDWTLALVSGDPRNPSIDNGIRKARYTMTLATVGTYPTNGIPVPSTPSTWGMKQSFRYLTIEDSSQNGNVYKYSVSGNAIRIYQNPASTSDTAVAQAALAEMATTATAGSGGTTILYVTAVGY